MSINNNFLLAGNSNKKSEKNKKLSEAQLLIKDILNSLKKTDYKVQETIQIIESYIKNKKGLERIIYSQLTTEVYSIDGDNEKEIIDQNISRMIEYSTNDDKLNDCQKIIVKFYDHYQLASFQYSKVNKEIQDTISRAEYKLATQIAGVEEASKEAESNYKNMEKQNITILGIFASVVLAFVGGMIFSSSVLNNIHCVSIYRLVFISCIIGIVFINMIHLLLTFLIKLNSKDDKNMEFFNLRFVNIIFILIMLFTFVVWLFKLK